MINLLPIMVGASIADMDLSWMKHIPVHDKYSKPPSYNRLSQKGRRRRERQKRSC